MQTNDITQYPFTDAQNSYLRVMWNNQLFIHGTIGGAIKAVLTMHIDADEVAQFLQKDLRPVSTLIREAFSSPMFTDEHKSTACIVDLEHYLKRGLGAVDGGDVEEQECFAYGVAETLRMYGISAMRFGLFRMGKKALKEAA